MAYRDRAEIVSIQAPVEPKKPIVLRAIDVLVNSSYENTIVFGAIILVSGGIAVMGIAINWLLNTLGFGLGVVALASFAFVVAIIFDVMRIKIQTYNKAMDIYNFERKVFERHDDFTPQPVTNRRKPPPTPAPWV